MLAGMTAPVSWFSTDGHWRLQPDFDAVSVNGRCAVSGLMKQPSEPGVFRADGLFDEFIGFYDISAYAITQAAKMLGYVPPEEVEKLKDEITDLEVRLAAAQKAAFKKAEDAVRMAAVRAQKADA
jgi:hypothetical protein